MTLNFYTLGVIYLVYSFLGWVAETVVATIRGGRFANRGAAAGPFCFIYGTTGVLLAVSFGDLRTEPVYLFFACMMAATVMEWNGSPPSCWNACTAASGGTIPAKNSI